MKRFSFLLTVSFIAVVLAPPVFTQTPVPMASQPGLSYTENFADIANWTDNFASGIGANRFKSVAVNANGTIPDGMRITAATISFQTGNITSVQRGTSQGTASSQSIVLLATGATDNSTSLAIDFLLDFSDVEAGTLSFDWGSLNNGTGNREGSLRIYWSVNGLSFTELTGAQVLSYENNSPTSGTVTNIELPAAFDDNPNARLRFYAYNATSPATDSGNRPKISIDNLTVTAFAPSAAPVSLTGRVVDGSGFGISKARIALEGEGMEPKFALTNPFGYYRFDELTVQQPYVVTVDAKGFAFDTPQRVVVLVDNFSGVDFVGKRRR